jgi:hypothetical protein
MQMRTAGTINNTPSFDEYRRFRYLETFKQKDTYTSKQLIKHVVKKFPYAIECIQTDNGFEFTNEMGNSKKSHLCSLRKLCLI